MGIWPQDGGILPTEPGIISGLTELWQPTIGWKIRVSGFIWGVDGAMLTNARTPDGYQLGADGAWTGK